MLSVRGLGVSGMRDSPFSAEKVLLVLQDFAPVHVLHEASLIPPPPPGPVVHAAL